MLDSNQNSADTNNLLERVIGALLLVISVLGGLLARMKSKLAKSNGNGKPVTVDAVIRATIASELRPVLQRLDDMDRERRDKESKDALLVIEWRQNIQDLHRDIRDLRGQD
jgi:hypothetical protein